VLAQVQEIVEIDLKIKLMIIAFLLIGCSNTDTTSQGLGHWVDTYPSEYSIWQCVEPFTPYKNKEC
jgi:hypothetical protein